MKKGQVISEIRNISEDIANKNGLELVDLELLRENESLFLRIYLYKKGGISIDDCQDFTRIINPILDEKDLIDENYYLEVSSPGLDRPLKNDKDLNRNIGELLDIKTYAPVYGKKNFVGELLGFDEETIVIKENEKEKILKRKDISKINIAIIF